MRLQGLRRLAVLAGAGFVLSGVSLAAPGTVSAAGLATPEAVSPVVAPPSSLPAAHLVGPFLEPQLVPGDGYYVTCNIAALSPDCSHLITSTGPPLSNLSPSDPAALVTMLINVPSAYAYLQNWIPYNAMADATLPAGLSTDPQYNLGGDVGVRRNWRHGDGSSRIHLVERT